MKFSKILDLFPAPKYLNIPYAGLSLSDSFIRCLQFHKKGEKLSIAKYREVALPAGLITAGHVNNKADLVEILKKLKKDLSLEYVKWSLPEERAYLFSARIPIVKESEVQSVVESKMEENVPVSPAELVFDYELIDHRNQGHLDIVVSALPQNVIDFYVGLAEAAGMPLLSLEIESQAVARAVLSPNNSGTVLITHFAQEKVSLYIVSARIVRFTSTVALKGELSQDPTFLHQEIKKLYIYWHTLKENVGKPEKKISQIIVCGDSFSDETISFISSRNQDPVILANVWINAFNINEVVPEIPYNDSLKYAPTVGLALPSDILI